LDAQWLPKAMSIQLNYVTNNLKRQVLFDENHYAVDDNKEHIDFFQKLIKIDGQYSSETGGADRNKIMGVAKLMEEKDNKDKKGYTCRAWSAEAHPDPKSSITY